MEFDIRTGFWIQSFFMEKSGFPYTLADTEDSVTEITFPPPQSSH